MLKLLKGKSYWMTESWKDGKNVKNEIDKMKEWKTEKCKDRTTIWQNDSRTERQKDKRPNLT